MKTALSWLLAALAVGTTAAVGAADLKAGEAKVKEVCQACHGLDGNTKTPDYPTLGGQRPDYLAKALRDYKSGARKNAIMGAFAGALTPQDIDNLAEYYAAQPSVLIVKH